MSGNAEAGEGAMRDSAEELAHSPLDALELFLGEVGRFQLLTAGEEIQLARLVERGDQGAKDRLINSNLRLVVSVARRYRGRELALLDLIQEGILGLIRATEKFDWRRGHKFSTYAIWWIRESIERGVANRSRMIRMPVYMVERERRITHHERTLTAELGRAPSDEEIAVASGLPLAQVEEIRRTARPVTSLDAPIGEDQATFGELIASEEAPLVDEVDIALRRESLRKALSKLPLPEREVVALRYGIDGDQCTIEQVMQRLELSRDRVRRLEARGLARLKHSPELLALYDVA